MELPTDEQISAMTAPQRAAKAEEIINNILRKFCCVCAITKSQESPMQLGVEVIALSENPFKECSSQ